MGYYQDAFFEDPNKICNCRWDDLYRKLQRYYDVQTDLSFFRPTDMSNKRFPLRRNTTEGGANTVTVVLDEKGVGTHVFVDSVNLAEAKLIFESGQEEYAFDADARAELKELLTPAKAAKKEKADKGVPKEPIDPDDKNPDPDSEE